MSMVLNQAYHGTRGYFVMWLAELGLEDFLRRYPLVKLVQWGWVIPQRRIVFPREFFTWLDHPDRSQDYFRGEPRATGDLEAHSVLWDSKWYVDGEDDPLWFIHPFWRPGDKAGELLFGSPSFDRTVPESQELVSLDGLEVLPYADFYYQWQGYALVDVIRFSDCIMPILNTPEVEESAQGIVRIAASIKEDDPSKILFSKNRWGGLAKPMTWLAHYNALCQAVENSRNEDDQVIELRTRGARLLAAHLGITESDLTNFIRNQLLKLAGEWMWANERHNPWTRRAWPHLQRDILNAVRWLCHLSGKYVSNYLDEWQDKNPSRGIDAALHEVLNFSFFDDKRSLLRFAPHYLKGHNEVVSENDKLVGEYLKETTEKALSQNYPFSSFLSAFSKLHEELSWRTDRARPLDLRDRRPMDYFALLAIRVEISLRYAIGKNDLSNLRRHNLESYIAHLAKSRGVLSEEDIGLFKEASGQMTKLYSMPEGGGIREIMQLSLSCDCRSTHFIRAFLACCLARNYFAHHHYLDNTLRRSEEGSFLISSMLVVTLCLL